MNQKKEKALMNSSKEALKAMRHVSSQIKEFFPDLSKVLDDAEKKLTRCVLDTFEE